MSGQEAPPSAGEGAPVPPDKDALGLVAAILEQANYPFGISHENLQYRVGLIQGNAERLKMLLAERETPCPHREDGIHCNCWYDGKPCCACAKAEAERDAERLKVLLEARDAEQAALIQLLEVGMPLLEEVRLPVADQPLRDLYARFLVDAQNAVRVARGGA